ncbi:predicted protein [Postia placenta Mad-698-R]|uniref:Uncharacterized protein n=1 Tax=Postia placenta MAD-698-R-SB12 TaxID=670580 RepID=A0A1X6MIN7_9APHY|nr:hypothetical protein POSPLADRAFT_1160728 [Postia placenta MAD-698-R-SB12]EED85795.1 predicted protein [Postia placenta Mad-698-R]OSX56198.1 hypothetical protein POSPLADRAFT_1160728 [Postia placenta MAD-698-R-SB12]
MSASPSEQTIEDAWAKQVRIIAYSVFYKTHLCVMIYQAYGYTFQAVYMCSTAIPPLVAALRVHALSGGNWRWVLPVWLLGIMPVGIGIAWIIFEKLELMAAVGGSSSILYHVMAVASSVSAVVSDILVLVATWHYISRTSSVRKQLVHDMWTARPSITTVMFRDGTLYFVHSAISLPNMADCVATWASDNASNISYLNAAISSILISHFLICIREAAECSTRAFSSQSLSFIDSQGNSIPRPWLSSIEFAADIANPSAGDGDADVFSDFEDDLDSRGENDAVDGMKLEECAASLHL